MVRIRWLSYSGYKKEYDECFFGIQAPVNESR